MVNIQAWASDKQLQSLSGNPDLLIFQDIFYYLSAAGETYGTWNARFIQWWILKEYEN